MTLIMVTLVRKTSSQSINLLQVFAENRPDRYGWLLKYYDEVYTALDLLLEAYYLKKYSKNACLPYLAFSDMLPEPPKFFHLALLVMWHQ